LACDFTQLKADARVFAASNNDPLFTIIGDLQLLSKNGPNAAATAKVFDALAQLAAMRGTPAQAPGGCHGSWAAFDRLVHRLWVVRRRSLSRAPRKTISPTRRVRGWMFEVRGGTADATSGVYERRALGEPYWATETIGDLTWTGTLNVASTPSTHRALIYGFHDETFETNDQAFSKFEHFTIPAIPATDPANPANES
jgi:hypothetical protein